MLINKIYEALQDVSGKGQAGGYIDPEEFNRSIELAQLDIFSERYDPDDELGFGSSYDSEEMYQAIKTKVSLVLSSGSVSLPTNFMYFSALSTNKIINGAAQRVAIPLCNDRDWNERQGSFVEPPTDWFPIARMRGSSLDVRPTTVQTVELNYLKVPATPWWNYTSSGKVLTFATSGGETTDPVGGTDSIDVVLGESEYADLVFKTAGYLGIQIRDEQLYKLTQVEKETE